MPSSGRCQFVAHPVDQAAQVGPQVVRDRRAVLVVQVHRVHELAVDVELQLLDARRCRCAPGASRGSPPGDRRTSSVSSWRPSMPYMICSAPSGPISRQRASSQLMKRVGLLGEADAHEAVQREGRVAQPGVAVVPVARAADVLGQAAGRRRDDGAGRLVGEQLEHQRRARDDLAPAPAVGAAAHPAAPVARSCR